MNFNVCNMYTYYCWWLYYDFWVIFIAELLSLMLNIFESTLKITFYFLRLRITIYIYFMAWLHIHMARIVIKNSHSICKVKSQGDTILNLVSKLLRWLLDWYWLGIDFERKGLQIELCKGRILKANRIGRAVK